MPDALASLDALLDDAAHVTLADRLNSFLDVLESDPSDPRVRRCRFTDPPVWCFVVAGSAEEWAVPWIPDSTGNPVVVHIGPIPF